MLLNLERVKRAVTFGLTRVVVYGNIAEISRNVAGRGVLIRAGV